MDVNLKQLDLAHQIGEILEKLTLDVMCLQEMSAACLGELLQVSEQRGYDVISPLHRQVTALEGAAAASRQWGHLGVGHVSLDRVKRERR
eukprot:s7079_g1.t1